MIFDKLANAKIYLGMNQRLAAALEYLRATDFSHVAPGKYEIDGNNVYALVQEYQTKPMHGRYEAHRKYIDVQFMFAGEEIMGYANLQDLKVTEEYIESKDALFLAGEPNLLRMKPGMFAIFYPEDAHIPGLMVNSPQPVKKVVMKVLL
jgi:YhcH/YjgK/YiaL family protein